MVILITGIQKNLVRKLVFRKFDSLSRSLKIVPYLQLSESQGLIFFKQSAKEKSVSGHTSLSDTLLKKT